VSKKKGKITFVKVILATPAEMSVKKKTAPSKHAEERPKKYDVV